MPKFRWRRSIAGVAFLALIVPVAAASAAQDPTTKTARVGLPERLPPGNYQPAPGASKVFAEKEKLRRADAWPRVKVWQQPVVPIEQADLAETNGPDSFKANDEVVCKFHPQATYGSGRTEKFYCILPTGRIIKVKYSADAQGEDNPEVRSEIVGTRLLRALGFGADIVYMPKVVRCFGCPEDPFEAQATSFDFYNDFRHAGIEVKMPGSNLESKAFEGWSFSELNWIDSSLGGASLAELDALRLLVGFVQNGDSKAANQSFICLPGGLSADGARCTLPFAYMHDLGAMFGGPASIKFDVKAWKSTRVWANVTCQVVRPASYSGPSFTAVQISEEGRLFLLDLMTQLSRRQIEDLFRGVRLSEAEVNDWADEFQRRVRYLDATNLRCKPGIHPR